MGPAAILQILITANSSQATAALSRTQAQLKSTAATANKTAATTQAAASRSSRAWASFAKGTALGAAAIGGAAIKMSIDFEEAMTQISTQAGASRKEVERLKQPVLDLARSSEFGPLELAKALFRVESAGFRGAEAMDILKSSTDLADVGQADLEETTRAYVAAQKSGIKGTKDFTKAAGLMNAIVGQGSMRMDDLVAAFGTGLLPRAKTAGVSLGQVGAALGVLTEQGMSSTSSATRLGMTLSFMTRNATGPAKEAMKELGIEQGQMAEMLRKPDGLLKVLELLNDRLKDIPASERGALLGDIFGGGRSSAAIQTLLGDLDAFEKKLEGVRKKQKHFAEDLAEDQGTTASKLNELWAGIQADLVELGDAIGPWVGTMAVILGKFLHVWSKIYTAISRVRNEAFGKLATVAVDVAHAVADAWEFVKGKFVGSGIPDAIRTVIGAFRDLRNTALNTIDKILGGISSFLDGIGKIPGGVPIFGGLANKASEAADAINDARDAVRGLKNAQEKAHDANSQAYKDFEKQRQGLSQLGSALDNSKGDIRQWASTVSSRFGSATTSSKNMVNAVGEGLKRLEGMVNNAIGGLGSGKPVSFNIGGGKDDKPKPAQRGAIISVPGSGSGDKVPAMLEPGEVVVNREAVKAMGGAQKVNALNDMIPRFASGGIAGLQPGISRLVDWASDRYGLSVSSGLRPGDSGSFHSSGEAADLVPPSMKATQGIFGAFKNQLEELFYDPWGGWDSGQMIGAIGGHMDHIHAAILGSGSGGPMGAAARLASLIFSGPEGALSTIGVGALSKVHAAASRYVSQNSMASHPESVVGGGSLSKSELVRLWKSVNAGVGNPNLMAAIALAESSGNPMAHGPPDGRGLWQIEWPVWGDTLGKYGNPYDPEDNARMAREVLNQQGLGAWVVYNTGAYQQFMQRGGVAGRNAPSSRKNLENMGPDQLIKRLLKRSKQGKSIKKIMEALKKITTVPQFTSELDSLTASYTDLIDSADLAALNDIEDADGNVIPGSFRGFTEAEWLGQAYAKMFEVRDRMLDMYAAIMAAREVANAALEKAKDRIVGKGGLIDQRKAIERQIGNVKGDSKDARKRREALRKDLTGVNNEIERLKGKVIDPLNERMGALGDDRSTVLDSLTGVQGSFPDNAWPERGSRPDSNTARSTYGGEINSVAQRLFEIGARASGGTAASSSESLDLQKQLTDDWMKRYFVSQSQYSTFAGMFAKGGYIPAGQWGIAGEAGPEAVYGPAQVVPSGGLGNIYLAVDPIDGRMREITREEYFAANKRAASVGRRRTGMPR